MWGEGDSAYRLMWKHAQDKEQKRAESQLQYKQKTIKTKIMTFNNK